jgi:hypothetical protein
MRRWRANRKARPKLPKAFENSVAFRMSGITSYQLLAGSVYFDKTNEESLGGPCQSSIRELRAILLAAGVHSAGDATDPTPLEQP